jgi:hypothetical protein
LTPSSDERPPVFVIRSTSALSIRKIAINDLLLAV